MYHNHYNRLDKTAHIFRVLSDPTRIKILELLFYTKKDLCVNDIAKTVEITQSAASHQLSKLEDFGIIHSYRMGQKMCYEILDNKLSKKVKHAIKDIKSVI